MTREKGANSRCEELTVLDAHPATGGQWEVLTEERWSFAAGHSRLRFRYMLALEAGHFRPLTMTPMLPEPESEKTR